MKVGVLTGTGTYALGGADARVEAVETPYGEAHVARGETGGVEILHISRHRPGHALLSNHVTHRANVAALRQLGADCVVAVTVCGALDTTVPLGSVIAFDDLHFLTNRLPDGSLCTFHDRPGASGRGHWIFERPFCEPVRRALIEACADAATPVRDGGCYGNVDGPRCTSRAGLSSLALAGVKDVSATL